MSRPLLEKMVNIRLVYTLERNGFLLNKQYSFQINRSTADVQEAFRLKQYFLKALLGLEKAYDPCWGHHIMPTLSHNKLREFYFVQNFMTNRSFRVICGEAIAERKNIENGVFKELSLVLLYSCLHFQKCQE
jgi:hypothetical protein